MYFGNDNVSNPKKKKKNNCKYPTKPYSILVDLGENMKFTIVVYN